MSKVAINVSRLVYILPGWVLALALAAVTAAAFAGRPLTVDDAEPVAEHQFEFEAGGRYNADDLVTHADFPFALTYGVLPNLEIGVGSGGQVEERKEVEEAEEEEEGAEPKKRIVTDVGDLTLGAKYKLLDAEQFWADHAAAFTVKFPTAGRDNGLGTGKTDYDLTWIVSKPISDKWGAHLNVGHTWTGDHPDEIHDDILHYGVAVDYQLTPSVQLVGEIFADTPTDHKDDTAAVLSGGLRWEVTEGFVLDAAVGGGLSDGAPAVIGTIGFTWAFGP